MAAFTPWGNEAWKRGPNGPPSVLQTVLSFPDRRSPWGAYNMAGNVLEWTTTGFPSGPQEWADLSKVLGNSKFEHHWYAIKGGFFGPDPKTDVFFKSYLRRGWPRDLGLKLIGFRCVKNAQ